MTSLLAFAPLAWVLLTIGCLFILGKGISKVLLRAGCEQKAIRNILTRYALISLAWCTVLLILSKRGWFAEFSSLPPRPAIALLLPLPFLIFLLWSRKVDGYLEKLPLHWPVYFQVFRIAVEVLLLVAVRAGKLPVQMSFEGLNLDILSGIAALYAGYRLQSGTGRGRTIGIMFNFLGLLLLANILVIAVLSMPTPFRYFMAEPANTLVAEFPYILLPGVLVPLAYGMHLISLRQLLRKSR